MKTSFLIILTILPILSFGQVNFKNPPWKLGCDTMHSQLEMNVCSLDAFNIADSILNKTYKKLINYLDKQYKKEKKEVGKAEDNFEIEYLATLKKERAAVIATQESFIEFRDNTTAIIEYEYDKGYAKPFIVNSYALELTVNQLKIMMKMSKEIIVEK